MTINKEYVSISLVRSVCVCVWFVLKPNHAEGMYNSGDNLMEETDDVFLHVSYFCCQSERVFSQCGV